MLASLTAEDQDATKVDHFERLLIESLEANPRDIISTDYEPDGLLAEVARAAGIRADCPPFPMKTVMWIKAYNVTVKYGYAQPIDEVWHSQKATQP